MRLALPLEHSIRLHRLLAWTKVPLLEWRAARYLATGPRPRIPFVHRPAGPDDGHVAEVRSRGGRIERIALDLDWARSRQGFSTLWRRLGVFVRLLSDRSIPDGDWPVDLDDAVRREGPFLGFCSRWRDTILVPDRGFFSTRGYADERRAARAAPPFEDRDPAIVWRGSPTGIGTLRADPMDASDPDLRQRVRLCLRLRDRPRSGPGAVDVRITPVRAVDADLEACYRAAGILGDFLPQRSWCRRRFAIDVDGNSNAFSNLFIRLLYGCCVIRVASPHGFRQWYHDRLEPGRHYVPVAADLSDVDDVVAWCHGHPADCRSIAREGQRVAMEMTFPAELDRTVETIRRRGQAPFAAATAATSAAS